MTIRRPHQLNTTQRGYGTQHQKTRAAWAPLVAAGQVICWRCNKLIRPGSPWDLGHDDHNRRTYRGPEHASCNRATARHKAANRRQRQATPSKALAWFNPSKHGANTNRSG